MTQGFSAWLDLFSANPEKSLAFYTELFHWQTETMKTPQGDYTMFKSGDKTLAGLSKAPVDALTNTWLNYITVNNLDNAIQTIQTQGGEVVVPQIKMPGIGRWVITKDPQNTFFAAFESEQPMTAPTSPKVPQGHFCWHELMCKDYKAALSFYSKVFDWQAAESIDMGPMGTYQVYNRSNDVAMGGMMNLTSDMLEHVDRPYWLEYIHVDDVDQTIQKAHQLGGKSTFPAMNIGDNESRIAGLVDCCGTSFAVWSAIK